MHLMRLEKLLGPEPGARIRDEANVRIVPLGETEGPQLWTDLHQASFSLPRPWSDERFQAEFNLKADSRGTWLWLALGEREDQAIGAIGLTIDRADAKQGHIRWLMVDPQARRRGIAGALLSRLETTARQQGIERLVAETSTTWIEAIAFYRRQGFTVD
jgi:ribosomal protein S18 acetylase RimI-like enzyme